MMRFIRKLNIALLLGHPTYMWEHILKAKQI